MMLESRQVLRNAVVNAGVRQKKGRGFSYTGGMLSCSSHLEGGNQHMPGDSGDPASTLSSSRGTKKKEKERVATYLLM